MRFRPISIALACLVVLAQPALAWVPEKTPRRELQASARRALALPESRGSVAGIVVRRGGRTVFSVNGGRPMAPASLMKLATTLTAIERFGADYRFVTRVLAPRRAASVRRLYVVGGGDPTLTTEAYRRLHFIPPRDDPAPVPVFPGGSPTIEQLASRIRASGVRRIGTLVVDGSLFDSLRTAPGWPARYFRDEPEVGLVDALTVNLGFGDLEGKRLLPSPALGAGDILRAALAVRGVSVAGPVAVGRSPRSAVEVARTVSPPLSRIVFFINRWSVNYPAELLLKALGAQFGGEGSTVAGARVVRETLSSLGIPVAGLRMADGSGLSVFNRITPKTLAGVIEHVLARKDRDGVALRTSFPVAGEAGTLFSRLNRAPTLGNLRGKTGLIRHVRSMAGWVAGADGIPLVYVVLFNRARSAIAMTRPIDWIGAAVSLFPLL
jgi:serine-type D-Ala-D-Ala carboxypeptidase/endopeptidase (penicillin-binding protein 4)